MKICLSIQQDKTKKQGQNNFYEKGTGLTLAVSSEDSELIPEGLILKLILAGETFNSFLLDGISKHVFISFLVFSESKFIGKNREDTKCTLNLSNWPLLSRQRNKDKITAMRKEKSSLWLLARNTLNSLLRD